MGDSQDDIALLAALTSHDSARFNPIIDRLRKEAHDIAMAMGIDAEGAVEQAIQKATDWLGGDAPFNVNRPWAYIKTLVHNEIISYGRTHKGETQSKLSEEETKALVIQIEGGSWDEGERNRRAESPGYRVTKERPTKYVEGSYTKALKRQLQREGVKIPNLHRWLRILDGLQGREKWITHDWFAYRYLMDKYRGKGIRFDGRAVTALLQEERDWRWQQYKLIKGFIDTIPSFTEQGIIEYFLRGYRVEDIATKLDVRKQYISRIVLKWMREWGWDKRRMGEARIILLTHCLANIYSKWERQILKELRRLRLELGFGLGFRYLYDLDDEEFVRELEIAMRPEREWREKRDRLNRRRLHSKVTTSPEAKSYFSDLDKSEITLAWLENVCSLCFSWWYGNIRKLIDEGRL